MTCSACDDTHVTREFGLQCAQYDRFAMEGLMIDQQQPAELVHALQVVRAN